MSNFKKKKRKKKTYLHIQSGFSVRTSHKTGTQLKPGERERIKQGLKLKGIHIA
jgi:hypothetical protein